MEETGSAPSEDKEGIEDGSVHHGESHRRRLSDDEQNASEEAPVEDGVASLLASELVQEAADGLMEETGSAPSEDKEGIEDGSVHHGESHRRRLSDDEQNASEEAPAEDGVASLLASELVQEAAEGLMEETGSAPFEDKEGIEDGSVHHGESHRRRLSDGEQNASEEAPVEDGVASLLASELVQDALEGLTEEMGSAPSEDKEGIEDGSVHHAESHRRRLSDDEQNASEEAPVEDGAATLLASELVQEAAEGLMEETGSAPSEDKEGIEDGSVHHGESHRRRLSDDEQNASEEAPVEDGVASLLASELVQEAADGLMEETGSAPSEDKEGIEDGSVHHGESHRRRLSDDEQNASEEAPVEDGVASLLASELVQEAAEGLMEETGSAPSEDKEGVEDGSVHHAESHRRRLSDDEQNASEEAPVEDGVASLLASELVQEAVEGLTEETGCAPSEDKEGVEDGSVHHGESHRRRLSDDEHDVFEKAAVEDGVASLLASEPVHEAVEGVMEETGSAPSEDKEGVEDGSVHHGESDGRRLSDDEQNASEEAPVEDGVASLLASELVQEAAEGLMEETGSVPSEDKEGIEDGSVHHGESHRRRLSDDEQNASEEAPAEDGVASLLASELVQEAAEGLMEETGSAPSEDKEGVEDGSVHHGESHRRRLSDGEQNASEEAPVEDGVASLLASELVQDALEGLTEEMGSAPSEDKEGIEDGSVHHAESDRHRLSDDEQTVFEEAAVEDGVASLLASEPVQEAVEGLVEETGGVVSEDKEGVEDGSVHHGESHRRRLSDDEQNASEEAPVEDGVASLIASELVQEALEDLMEETGSVVSEDKEGIEDGFVLHSGADHRRLEEVALDTDNESFSRVAGNIQGSAADVVGANGAEGAEDGCLQKSREAEMPPVTALEQPPEVAHVEVDLGVSTDVRRLSSEQDGDGEQSASETAEGGDYEGKAHVEEDLGLSTDVRRLSNEQDGDGEQPAPETVEEGDYEGKEKDFGPTISVLPGTDVDSTETALPVGTSEDLGDTLSDVTEEGIEHQTVFSLRRRLAATKTTREYRDHEEKSLAGSNVNHATEAEGGATDDADAHMLNDISEEATEPVNQDAQCTAEALTLRRLLAEEDPSAETVDPEVPEAEWEDEGHCGCGHCADIDDSTSAYGSTEDSSTSDLESDAVPNTNAFLRGAAVAHQ